MSQEFIKELERMKAEQEKLGGSNASAPVTPPLQPQAPEELLYPEQGMQFGRNGYHARDPNQFGRNGYHAWDPNILGSKANTADEGGFFSPGGFGYEYLGGRLGENIGQFVGEQKYGTGLDVEGEATGRPLNPRGLPGQTATLGASALELVGDYVIDPVATAAQVVPEYVTGLDLTDSSYIEAPTTEVQPATPESTANPLVNGTNAPTPAQITEEAQITETALQAQLPSTIQNANGQGLTGFKPKYEGQSLTDFMAGRDDPSAASVQVQDPQGRFRRQAAPVAGETPEQNKARTDSLFPEQAAFEQASADREARQAARPDFGEAQTRAAGTVTDRERRAARGDGISDADRRDIAKAQSPNASDSERARGMKVAEIAGLDWRTGQPIKQDKKTGGLTDYQAITAQQRQTEIDMKIAEGLEEKEAKRVVEYEESRNNVRSTRDSFEKLKPVAEEIALLSGSKFTEGALGWTASKLPFSTDAAQIERLTTEFEGSAFLQGLIDAKAKGATFGALSEREGDRILGQWGKITSPKSTNEERIRAINSMLDSIQRSSERAESDHKEKFPELSAKSEDSQTQGSAKGKRYPDDQDHGAKVETYFQGK